MTAKMIVFHYRYQQIFSLNNQSIAHLLFIKLFQGRLYIDHNSIMLFKRILVIVLLSTVIAWEFNNPYRPLFQPASSQTMFLFDQILDHSNYLRATLWQQRYYVFDDYYSPEIGPVILYICGQSECKGISATSFTARIAKETSGLVLSLQHRFYGKSLPFGNASMNFQNLKFLTSEQALSDLGNFIKQINATGKHGVHFWSQWLVVGGSYAGALSAWFQSKYPHLTFGAISSSGVIKAVQDFSNFDEQIYLSLLRSGQSCVEAVRSANSIMEARLFGPDGKAFQAELKAEYLSADEFLFYWNDVIVFQVQYGRRTAFCTSLEGKAVEGQFEVIKNLAKGVSPVDYGAYYLKDADFAIKDGRGGRAWIFQSCTEFSYFQTYSLIHPMRSTRLNLDFYKKWCGDIFGTGVWPFVRRANNEYGGDSLQASHLFMTNGVEDPWRWASLQASRGDITSQLINCNDCAHCADLHAPNSNDPKELTQVREEQMATIKSWLLYKKQAKQLIFDEI